MTKLQRRILCCIFGPVICIPVNQMFFHLERHRFAHSPKQENVNVYIFKCYIHQKTFTAVNTYLLYYLLSIYVPMYCECFSNYFDSNESQSIVMTFIPSMIHKYAEHALLFNYSVTIYYFLNENPYIYWAR